MAEKKNVKKSVYIDGKYILAVFDVPKSNMKHLESRRILQGVHVRVDKSGRWLVEATDSFKLAQVSSGYVGGKHADYDFTLPPETVAELKATDLLTFEPDAEKNTCKLARMAKGGNVTEWEFNLLEGKYPNVDQLIPDGLPEACYRFAVELNADYVACLMGVAKKVFGKGAQVIFATSEDKQAKPVMGYAEDGVVRLTMLAMPLKLGKNPFLGKARPYGKDEKAVAEMAEELRAAKAERDKFAEKAKRVEQKGDGKLKDRVKELEGELAEAKAAIADAAGKLKETRAELDEVWKENAKLKAKREVPPAPKAPKAEPKDEAAAAVSLETVRKWCEGKGLVASQKREGTCIWVEGDSKAYKDELTEMGLRFSKKRKSWYINPAA